MNISLPKIKLGKDYTESSVFDFDHDVNTTAEFGFLQPIFVHEMMPRSVMKFRAAQFVRLAALNSPTFGRVSANTYHRFVPISELLPSFEYLLAGKPYYTATGNYVPASLPYTSVRDLTLFLLCCTQSLFTIYRLESNGNYKAITGAGDATTVVGFFNSTYCFGGVSSTPGLLDTANWTGSWNSQQIVQLNNAQFNVSPRSADFVVKLINGSGTSTKTYYICFHFSQVARRLRKILLGCGYQLNLRDSSIRSVMPLFAYYKAWFDLFQPKQTVTWTSTHAFKFLDRCRENNVTSLQSYYIVTSDWYLFLQDLCLTYYTQKPDFVSANIATPALSETSVGSVKVSSPSTLEMVGSLTSGANTQPSITGVSTNVDNRITRNRLLLLNRLTKFVNKNTIIGGKIADYLHVHYGADFGDDLVSYEIGQQSVDCKITDQMSTAATDQALLGEYAGKGIGADKGHQLTYRASQFGYWISMLAIVPNSGYCQSVDLSTIGHLTRFDFPNQEWDALGFEITQKDQVCGAEDVYTDVTAPAGTESASFGYVPRLTHCKYKPNIANGNISLRSSRTTFLPYMLDRWFSTNEIQVKEVDNEGVTEYQITDTPYNIPVASEEWRYLTKHDYMGNFNRVFYNSGYASQVLNVALAPEDNFIVHNLLDVKYIAPLLPIGESFDTDAQDDNALSVTKA